MPSPLAEAFLMGILNGCYETPSKGFMAIIDTPLFILFKYITRNEKRQR